MTILYNPVLASMVPTSIANSLMYAFSCALCTGTVPDDASIATMTSASALITGAQAGTPVAFAANSVSLVNTTAIPPVWWYSGAAKTMTVTRAGTIGWAALYGTDGTNPFLYVASVSLVNQGGIIQLDKTTVAVGDLVSLAGFSFSLWR